MLAWLDENDPQHGHDHFLNAYRAGALALLGRFDEARALLARTRADLAERGGGVLLAHVTGGESVWVELWAGDAAAAADFADSAWSMYERLGERSPLAAAFRGQALYALGRLDDAAEWAARVEALGLRDQRWGEAVWRQVRAKVLARRGECEDAERVAREAVAICDETDRLNAQADAYADLGEVFSLCGNPDGAADALQEAHARYERKGNLVGARRVADQLSELGRPAAR